MSNLSQTSVFSKCILFFRKLFIVAIYVHNLRQHCINSVNITSGHAVEWALTLVRSQGLTVWLKNEDIKLTLSKI